MVQWSNGDWTVEHYESDEKFFSEFVKTHGEELISAEPHYKVPLDKGRLSHRNPNMNWGIEKVGTPLKGSENLALTKVGVVDSGADLSNPWVGSSIDVNTDELINGLDDDGNGFVDDRWGYDFLAESHKMKDHTGHGTHMIANITGVYDQGKLVGVSPHVKVIPIAFMNHESASVKNALRSIQYALSRGVRIINASWGVEGCSPRLREEIQLLSEANVLFVTAAGNNGESLSEDSLSPASFKLSNQITVGASTFEDQMADFSNYGPRVDLVAPGMDIYSTYPLKFSRTEFKTLSGTSVAVSFVVRGAAVLWSHKPQASYREIKEALLQGVSPGPYRVRTQGVLNIPKSLSLVKGQESL